MSNLGVDCWYFKLLTIFKAYILTIYDFFSMMNDGTLAFEWIQDRQYILKIGRTANF